ncbi:Isoleucine--tRNA ligase [Tetrabaena socialis]|uniref:Isoleucine--tRNA ligase n=1 Tax=Tetrabaena socialis TaxID=47790 RepID=A0A2J7ZYM8_9CHLO|nr:Isoleucine--tRNA ligase [Tetrabaena socialis]|eukprot:PNH05372.1 Isoleucine--tRNA ligase [Tetrabaena socialis]
MRSLDVLCAIVVTPGVLELRTKAREFALRTIDSQRAQFQRYGVWGDWSAPYVTLQPAYEAAQLQVFGKMFLNGHIYSLVVMAAKAGAGAAPAGAGKKGKRAGKEDGGEEASGPYSATVRLPATEFSLRANSPVREPQIQQFWEQHAVYQSLLENGKGVRS